MGWIVSVNEAMLCNIWNNRFFESLCSVETDMNRDGSHPKHENCVK